MLITKVFSDPGFEYVLLIFADDVNADGRADVVCTADGGVMVWEAKKEIANIYDLTSKWIDDNFGFCVFQDKRVQFRNRLCFAAYYLHLIPNI